MIRNNNWPGITRNLVKVNNNNDQSKPNFGGLQGAGTTPRPSLFRANSLPVASLRPSTIGKLERSSSFNSVIEHKSVRDRMFRIIAEAYYNEDLTRQLSEKYIPNVADIQKMVVESGEDSIVGELPPELSDKVGKKHHKEAIEKICDTIGNHVVGNEWSRGVDDVESLQNDLGKTFKDLGVMNSNGKLEVKSIGYGSTAEIFKISFPGDTGKPLNYALKVFRHAVPPFFPNAFGNLSELNHAEYLQKKEPTSQVSKLFFADLKAGFHFDEYVNSDDPHLDKYVNLMLRGLKYSDNHARNYIVSRIIDHGGLVGEPGVVNNEGFQKFLSEVFVKHENHDQRIAYLKSKQCPPVYRKKLHELLTKDSAWQDCPGKLLIYTQEFIDHISKLPEAEQREIFLQKINESPDDVKFTESCPAKLQEYIEATATEKKKEETIEPKPGIEQLGTRFYTSG